MRSTKAKGINEEYPGRGEKPGMKLRIAVIKKYTLLTRMNWRSRDLGKKLKL
jgi:hypothetical protein